MLSADSSTNITLQLGDFLVHVRVWSYFPMLYDTIHVYILCEPMYKSISSYTVTHTHTLVSSYTHLDTRTYILSKRNLHDISRCSWMEKR